VIDGLDQGRPHFISPKQPLEPEMSRRLRKNSPCGGLDRIFRPGNPSNSSIIDDWSQIEEFISVRLNLPPVTDSLFYFQPVTFHSIWIIPLVSQNLIS